MRLNVFTRTVIGLSAAVVTAAFIAEVTAEEKESSPVGNVTAPAVSPFDGVPKETLEAWKKKYAFQSLSGRLAYEKSADRTPPKLGTEAAEHLKQIDQGREVFRNSDRRSISLALLHGENVEQFTKAPGFGFSRMPPPGPTYLRERPETPQIPFARVGPLSEDETSSVAAAPLPQTAGESSTATRAWKLPAAEDALVFHRNSAMYFTQDDRFGFVKSVEQVAGFESHAVTYAVWPPVDRAQIDTDDKSQLSRAGLDKRWKVARLELVSLLKQETPRVYLSENLPRMDELSSVKTRAVTAFETAGLEKLVAGDDLHTASTPNRIEMLGSLRASKQCMQCHEVPHGTLLGAFTYELRRDPPITVAKEKLAPVQ
jgi:hypothetical protein